MHMVLEGANIGLCDENPKLDSITYDIELSDS